MEREARAAARLNHPGIVGIYELASDEHDVYLVSELVRGRTLGELLRVGALADRDVARIGMAVCDALDHAHERGVIHRDVKPGTSWSRRAGRGRGLRQAGRLRRGPRGKHDPLTRTGDVVGTLAYMAPEQAEGARGDPGQRCLLAGADALRGLDRHQPRARRRPGGHRPPPRPPAAVAGAPRRDLPLDLCDAIDDALEIDPARRPPPGTAIRVDAAVPELDDQGGLVEPATLRRVGLPTTEGRRPADPAAARPRRADGHADRAFSRDPRPRAAASLDARRGAARAGSSWAARDARPGARVLPVHGGGSRRAGGGIPSPDRLAAGCRRALCLVRLARRGPPGHCAAARRRSASDTGPAAAGQPALVGAGDRPAAGHDRAGPASWAPPLSLRPRGGGPAWLPAASSGWPWARS